ncbi:MAG TPA: alpha-ketoacid dehydrogenase subunit beta [Acholeplasmataceae bacterium]|jgi:pyruvate dehydrogenase E1 component beta subunit|nr:alpha-ketoacid dehydrogenase subunit beta [Acholeplasmataceae bacterium]
MALMNLLEAVNHTLDQQMTLNKDIILYGEDIGYGGGVFRTTAGLQKNHGNERVIDTPIAEAGIVGSAIGMAIGGLRPIVEIQFSGFLFPAYNELVTHAARMRNRSRGRFYLPMVVRMPYGGGVRALEHHSESLETLIAHIPGLKLVIPSTPYDAKGLLTAAIKDNDPVIFMEPKRIYRAFRQEVPEEEYEIPLGKARIVRPGNRITVVAWGAMVREVENAIKLLDDENVVELIDLRTIAPFDKETIIESVKKTGRILIVHEAVKSFGPAAEIMASVNEKAFYYLEAAPARLTGFDITVPLARGEHYHLVDPKKIVNEIKRILSLKA